MNDTGTRFIIFLFRYPHLHKGGYIYNKVRKVFENEPVGKSTLNIEHLLPGWLQMLSNQMLVSLMDPNIEQPLPTTHWGGC